MYLVRSGALEGYAAITRSLGANPLTLMKRAGLSESQLRDPNTHVSYSSVALLLELSASACEEPSFGLRLAFRQGISVLGDLFLVLAERPTVAEAMAHADQYLYLHANGVRLEQRRVGEDVELGLVFDLDSELGIAQLAQLSVGQLANFTAELLGCDNGDIPIFLRGPAPARHVERVTGPGYRRVQFDARNDSIRVPARWLQRRSQRNEEAVRRHFREHLRGLQTRYPDNLPDQVREVIGRMLPSGECRIDRVAAALGLSARVLQKRLQALGTHFGGLLQAVRRDIATQHLGRGSLSVSELALYLGYAEVSVFSRHFKRWTGVTPREWRARSRRRSEDSRAPAVPAGTAPAPGHRRVQSRHSQRGSRSQ